MTLMVVENHPPYFGGSSLARILCRKVPPELSGKQQNQLGT
jgi:hypothetical protein